MLRSNVFVPAKRRCGIARSVRAGVRWWVILVASLCPLAATGEESGPFDKAIAEAQARTVKIYGAGIGREPGYATGLIVSADGHILTAHGIYLAGERLWVVLPDGSRHRAEVERRSTPIQVAMLKIDAKTPDYFETTDKPAARRGDWVLGVSNAFKVADGPEPLSVNLGVVSLRTRLDIKRGTQRLPYEGDVLLIDAITSNPGAPGGALVTSDGRLAGMIGRITESESTGTRINYAVPSDLLHKFIEGRPLGSDPSELRPGITGIRVFTLGDSRAPAYVDRILPGSPAAGAGIRPDDLILSIGGKRVSTIRDFRRIGESLPAGKPVAIVIKRKDRTLSITLTPVEESDR